MARFKGSKQKKIFTTIEGGNELKKMLDEIGDTASDILEKAAEAGGKVALEAARNKCPVNTGALKRSLHIEKVKNKKPEIRQSVRISPGKDEYYGTFVELGTSKVASKPYLRPAIDENKAEIAKAINNEVLHAIGRIK